MPDRLYLSYWLRGYTGQNMLRHFEKALRLFPYSRLKPGAALTVYAVEPSEPALLERAYAETPDAAELLNAAREFRADDCAVEVEACWDLWQFESEWKLRPTRVLLTCHGPRFERDPDDHIRLDFGLEDLFLPQPDLKDSLVMVRSNIRSLLHLVHGLDDALVAERRQLWSESGANFAERLQAALGG